ncbi:MAG TPA: nuclear transport factor 2 family protein [Acidimicrobiia bacterium]|jgi:ketosteroid isomerase-like protein
MSETARVIEAFTDATNRHDLDAMLALVSEQVVFETTTPPDGDRLEGRAAVRAAWSQLFRESPHAYVETEELIVSDDRGTARMRYVFDREDPEAGHVRAVDVLRVTAGLISEKLSYVKG